MDYADTGTCTTPGLEKSFDITDLQRAVDMLCCMPPEPIGQWMRSKGHPPEQWTLVVPKKMFDDFGNPVFLPDYVRRSAYLDKPVFIRKGL